MDTMAVVEAWDRSLRDADWSRARDLLSDDATYVGMEAEPRGATCGSPDEIVGLMRSWKGRLPDVEVVAWGVVGECVVAWLRQPAFPDHGGWYQTLRVRDGKIARLSDHETREEAAAAALSSAG